MGFYSGLNEVQGSLGIKRDPFVDLFLASQIWSIVTRADIWESRTAFKGILSKQLARPKQGFSPTAQWRVTRKLMVTCMAC